MVDTATTSTTDRTAFFTAAADAGTGARRGMLVGSPFDQSTANDHPVFVRSGPE